MSLGLPEPSNANLRTAYEISANDASPDPDEKLLLVSGALATPLPNTKLVSRKAFQEATEGDRSC